MNLKLETEREKVIPFQVTANEGNAQSVTLYLTQNNK